jgi:hypothetical protein
MHWLESDGCRKAVVIENLFVFFLWRFFLILVKARFSPGRVPTLMPGLLLGAALSRYTVFVIEKI